MFRVRDGLLCFGAVANAQLPVSPIPDPIPALIPLGQATAELPAGGLGFCLASDCGCRARP